MNRGLIFLIVSLLSSPVMAASDRTAVDAFSKAVKKGNDIQAQFPGLITSADAATLRSVAKCRSQSPFRQKKGRYSIVFDCGPRGAVFAIIAVSDGRLVSIETGQAVKMPDGAGR